jgi:hypothetical protein
MLKTYIYITTQFVAYHKWDDAPDGFSFLKSWHRHLFKVKVYWKVDHNDRDKEFFLMKEKADELINTLYADKYLNVDNSCEMIATRLAEELGAYQAEVSEDGENGAIVRRIEYALDN